MTIKTHRFAAVAVMALVASLGLAGCGDDEEEGTVEVTETDEELAPADTAHKAELDADVDSLLDEIDSVLESNAEEFVRSFVQKGGQ